LRGSLIDAGDLIAWADRRSSEEDLPKVLRWLIQGSPLELHQLAFRSGEGVNLRGWDGLVDASNITAWVPAGKSGWELGTGRDVKGKAESDYEKRTSEPEGISPADSTFVFVTPRRWAGKDEWAQAKRSERVWKYVRAYDADDLEQWLDAEPAVHARVTRLLGRDPAGARDLVTSWDSWSSETDPALPAALFTAGRDRQVEEILQWLRREPSATAVVAESQDEAIGFIAASLIQLPEPELTAVETRTLVVQSEGAWNDLLERNPAPMILIPTFNPSGAFSAVRAGHRVIVPVGRDAVLSDDGIRLPRLNRLAARAELIAGGLPEPQAEELADLARRGLVLLRRRLSLNPTRERPAWALPPSVAELIPIVLAGSWQQDSGGDRDILSRLTGREYGELEDSLMRWANDADPPVKQDGQLWFVTSREDSWELTRQFVTAEHLRRLKDCSVEVLGDIDPSLDLEPNQRWAAGAFGKTPRWSGALRRGLADALALLATRPGDVALQGAGTGQAYSDSVVRIVLDKANSEPSGHLWASLEGLLPQLAEASPGQFLDAVDRGLSDGPLQLIFDPAQEDAPLGWPTHTGLLWALEALAWSPEYLSLAADSLARLEELDPGGRWANRPIRSLRQIFLGWDPNTTASLDQRLSCLDRLRANSPAVAWTLMLGLLPNMTEASVSTYRPRWRDWGPTEERKITDPDWGAQTKEVARRLVDDVGKDSARWVVLIGALDQLTVTGLDSALQRLHELEISELGADGQSKVVDALRTAIHRHSKFADADWSLPRTHLERLKAELQRLEPSDVVERSAWLFNYPVRMPGRSSASFEDEQAAVNEAQDDALRVIFAANGISGIWSLAEQCEALEVIGYKLASIVGNLDSTMISTLDADAQVRVRVATGYFRAKFESDGWDWAEGHLAAADKWPSARAARFLTALSRDSKAFDWADRLGGAIRQEYWRTVNVLWPEDANDRIRASRMLLGAERASAALEQINGCIHGETADPGLDSELIMNALEQATPGTGHNQIEMFIYYAKNCFIYLEATAGVDRRRLARLEWRYLPLFEFRNWVPRILHEELGRSPEFFVDVVSMVYRSDDEREENPPNEETYARARVGDQLLRSWRRPPLSGNGSASGTLAGWVASVRELLRSRGLLHIGDMCIGHVLRYVPEDSDGSWPTLEVRNVIESTRSQQLEEGIELEVLNSHGQTTRALGVGGVQERSLAKRYGDYGRLVVSGWPRTGRMLARIAEAFEDRARREDETAAVEQDFPS
jgi:hypothetical protein